ncbi:hemerythrin domain-containing protein [Trichlorobacter lovleyi]|uniref:Hemerythrin HHE cation binding domain protein n=1 Tax=Trichlorobacter lovleyi (strain ATCC BAA-1151 / DSM 17278 / SZ) TaxID=398767 RepID=B3EAW8_TRIL1|nr:hemerythrin domain-containing protein [Trichlorobacter lovleyi]ACD93952.1 Hemerythrin HHE cation binding domain protein [Trichlorobacter lovleyi SZ]
MKTDITKSLVDEHQLILRMITLLEKNAPLTAEGKYLNWQFYLDGIDFIRQYADRFHHAKEEDVLFKALVDNGMPKDNSPVAAMLMEHGQGRSFVCAMEIAVLEAQSGRTDTYQAIAENVLGYASLLRGHIGKEDDILYPLSERVLPEIVRASILEGYRSAEAQIPSGVRERYNAIVTQYEQE